MFPWPEDWILYARKSDIQKWGGNGLFKTSGYGSYNIRAALRAMAEAMYQAGRDLNEPVVWGGDFNGDGPDVGNDGWD